MAKVFARKPNSVILKHYLSIGGGKGGTVIIRDYTGKK